MNSDFQKPGRVERRNLNRDSDPHEAFVAAVERYVTAEMSAIRKELINTREHHDGKRDAQTREITALIKTGYPNGDVENHRKVHEGYIQEMEEKVALWKSVKEKTLSGVVWASLGILATAIVEFLKNEVKK